LRKVKEREIDKLIEPEYEFSWFRLEVRIYLRENQLEYPMK
jgi:hypothetical protein